MTDRDRAAREPLWKTSRAERRKWLLRRRKERRDMEAANKRAAKARDGFRCRFPLCGCRAIGERLDARVESSHDKHKGMGGDPTGGRSLAAGLMTLCLHRHQNGIVSRHKGTLRARPLTPAGNAGPVAWDVSAAVLRRFGRTVPEAVTGEWVEVAKEHEVQRLDPPEDWQRAILDWLAEMEA